MCVSPKAVNINANAIGTFFGPKKVPARLEMSKKFADLGLFDIFRPRS